MLDPGTRCRKRSWKSPKFPTTKDARPVHMEDAATFVVGCRTIHGDGPKGRMSKRFDKLAEQVKMVMAEC